MLHGHDTEGGGRTHGRRAGQQDVWHPERARTGVVQRGVPLHRPRKRVQPAAQGEERRHPHDAQRHARPGVRRTPVQAGGEDDLQPATQDAAQLHQAPRGQGLPPDAGRPLRPAARTAVRTGVRGADEPSERILK